MQRNFLFASVLLNIFVQCNGNGSAPQVDPLQSLSWLTGHWVTLNDGKVFWPTIPKMTYREELWIFEAPVAKEAGIRFLNFT